MSAAWSSLYADGLFMRSSRRKCSELCANRRDTFVKVMNKVGCKLVSVNTRKGVRKGVRRGVCKGVCKSVRKGVRLIITYA